MTVSNMIAYGSIHFKFKRVDLMLNIVITKQKPKGTWTLWEVIDMFIILIVVMVS